MRHYVEHLAPARGEQQPPSPQPGAGGAARVFQREFKRIGEFQRSLTFIASGLELAGGSRRAAGGAPLGAGPQEAGGESCGDGQVAGPRDGGRFWDGFVFPAAQLELGLGLLWASAQSSSWIQKAEPGRCLDEIRPITVKRIS